MAKKNWIKTNLHKDGTPLVEETAIALIQEVNTINSFIHTSEFVSDLCKLIKNGLSRDICKEYIETHDFFDANGMDKGTNYSNTEIAFSIPVIHPEFQLTS